VSTARRPDELNRQLALLTNFTSTSPPAMPTSVDWPELVAVAERQGLAAIASYQLEYRLIGKWRAPPEARERLQLTFNGLLNDNVHKLTRLKQLLSEQGAPDAILLGDAAVADAFYPHIAFRPVESIDLLVRGEDLAEAQRLFTTGGAPRGAHRLSDSDVGVTLWTQPPGLRLTSAELDALWRRRVAARPYGPSAFRAAPVDAFLLQVAALADDAFQVVRVLLVDLREMALRAAAGEPFHGPGAEAALDPRELLARARVWRLGRALFTAMTLVAALFPDAREAAQALTPEVPARAAALLQRAVVKPALDPRRTTVFRASQAARKLLLRAG
jgi:hypothetical protein